MRSPSPPPLIPPRPYGSQTNLAAISSLEASTELVNSAPPIPLKSMHDKELMGSTELLLCPPPSSSVLTPNPTIAYQEDDYDIIENIQKQISPISQPEIYKSPTNEPVKQELVKQESVKQETANGKPVGTPPYQPRGKGMGGILASLKKTDLFKQKSSIPISSYTPNIPTSETLVTSDMRGKVEYGPVGFGVRLAKPKGPRTTPFTWGNHAPESF